MIDKKRFAKAAIIIAAILSLFWIFIRVIIRSESNRTETQRRMYAVLDARIETNRASEALTQLIIAIHPDRAAVGQQKIDTAYLSISEALSIVERSNEQVHKLLELPEDTSPAKFDRLLGTTISDLEKTMDSLEQMRQTLGYSEQSIYPLVDSSRFKDYAQQLITIRSRISQRQPLAEDEQSRRLLAAADALTDQAITSYEDMQKSMDNSQGYISAKTFYDTLWIVESAIYHVNAILLRTGQGD